MAPQVVLTLPLLEGTDGVQKMSKSLGNYIGISEPAGDIFGKVMSISDELMLRYFDLLTELDPAGVRAEIEAGGLHPMEAKKRLAGLLVERFHGATSAAAARAAFEQRFQRRQLPDEVPEYSWCGASGGKVRLVELLTAAGMASSMSDARRKIQQGGVRVDGQRVTDIHCALPCRPVLLQVGPKSLRRIVFPSD
jgi:tyrosyl-tRNA synthetase